MKIFFVSLGCDKNLVDSEMMLGMLSEAGHEITDDEYEADVVVVNTCCFILDAKEESINALIEYGELKQNGKLKLLVATGCLAQRYAKEIHDEIPEVDVILGTASFDEIVRTVEEAMKGNCEDVLKPLTDLPVSGKKRRLTTGGHYAYLKIAEGCDKKCSYCIIPKIRGEYRSVPMDILLKEAEELADAGVKELILVAQETTVYGKDLYQKKALPELLQKLCKLDGLEWIRLLYCYPEEIDDALIQVMKEEEKICNYLDMPIQHADDTILQRMGRRTNRAFLEQLITKLRNEIPDICLRTTLITGFPGETEEQIPEDVKAQRRDTIMEIQQTIAFEKAEEKEGKELPVMVEGRLWEEDVLVARSYMDAPGVDGYVFINSTRDIASGTMERVRITSSNEYDLIGEI